HGVLFRGNAEARIRENLLKQGFIKGIIGLPANLFYGTGIPACIIIIDKETAHQRAIQANGYTSQSLFMIDASKGFIKDGNKNRLREQDIHKIVDTFTREQLIPRYSRAVPLSEIAANDYNLNIPRYIDASEAEDLHDLAAHLKGGIPNRDIDALGAYWQVFPTLRADLFAPAHAGYSHGLVEAAKVKGTILAHPEFIRFATASLEPFSRWFTECHLAEMEQGESPKALIEEISESLLAAYAPLPLLDNYDIYQLLLDYWHAVMQDDVYVLCQDGWAAGKVLRELKVDKGEKLKETPDLVLGRAKYKAELLPPALLVARFFSDKQAEIDALQATADEVSQHLESYLEEQGGEEGLLSDAANDAGKINAASLKARLKQASDADEKAALKTAIKHFDEESRAKKTLKEAQETLDRAVLARYPKLTEDEIKQLLVEDKWKASLQSAIEAEIERITQQLANRVKELEERYRATLPQLTQQVADLEAKVAAHLKSMGLEWA
ncbi:N-6 DNA methylase, partial [Aeromonas sp. L_1B5_3]|uniref:N-6 DNA methylase n=1 Tax=Aeromonas sp. L_1B5_3 TaxID=1588629 RepID=UPI0005B6FD48